VSFNVYAGDGLGADHVKLKEAADLKVPADTAVKVSEAEAVPLPVDVVHMVEEPLTPEKAATRAPTVARFNGSGKVDNVPLTGQATVNKGNMECLETDCSAEKLMVELTKWEQQLAQHEQRISPAMADVTESHLRNHLANCFSIQKCF